MDRLDPQKILIMAVAFLIGITVHEFAHARMALAAGDDTAKLQGRVTLNPMAHLDPIGSLMFLLMMVGGFGLAWGKPVPVNPLRFRNPRWDNLRVSIAGPVSNLLIAIVLSALLRFWIVPSFIESELARDYATPVALITVTNIGLAIFNLLPIPPLDGSHILSSLMPSDMAYRFERSVGRYGTLILLGLILIPGPGGDSIISFLIGRPIVMIFVLLAGTHPGFFLG